ncbi:MAG: DUF881 domain-containing protein [Actinobacteria bacterium]|nr:DUF881 domain-containing protein [Actinomycetota bacterium]
MFAAAANTSQGTDLRAQRATELRDLVRQKSDRVNALEADVAGRRQTVDALTEGRSGDPSVATARQQVLTLSSEAGLTEVAGRAVQVTLDDAPAREPDDPLWQAISPNDVIVHQADVQAVVNALWRGGAEAIQVMDQRLINTSSLQCVGNTLLLQGRVYSPPYVITAVGPAKRMRAAVRSDPSVASYRDWADVVGLGYDIRRLDRAVIPAYTGPITMSYATTTSPSSASGVPMPQPDVSTDPAVAAPSAQPSQ